MLAADKPTTDITDSAHNSAHIADTNAATIKAVTTKGLTAKAATAKAAARPIVRIEKLSYRLGARQVFRDISLNLYAGDCLVIGGREYRAKSELLNILGLRSQGATGNIELYPHGYDKPIKLKRTRKYLQHIFVLHPRQDFVPMTWRQFKATLVHMWPLIELPSEGEWIPADDVLLSTLGDLERHMLWITIAFSSGASLILFDRWYTLTSAAEHSYFDAYIATAMQEPRELEQGLAEDKCDDRREDIRTDECGERCEDKRPALLFAETAMPNIPRIILRSFEHKHLVDPAATAAAQGDVRNDAPSLSQGDTARDTQEQVQGQACDMASAEGGARVE